MSNVIVFGPTGSVASVVALTAQEQGAKVHLAMRDTKKIIPGLNAESEKAGSFERVYADLTKPETVAAAVKSTGANRAFFYLAWGTPDHMKATLQAMKSAGVEFVVFLSSYTIEGELDEIPPSEMIAYAHARVEMSLDEVFGPETYVALRPGGFATNLLRYKEDIKSGEVRIFKPDDVMMDHITPTDMGRAGGVILVKGPQKGQTKVYLYGPKVLSQGEAIPRVGRVLGRSVRVTAVDEQEALELYSASGMPRPLAEFMVRKSKGGPGEFKRPEYEQGVENVKLYAGRPALGLEEWVEANKELFTG